MVRERVKPGRREDQRPERKASRSSAPFLLLPFSLLLCAHVLSGCATDPTRGYASISAHPGHIQSVSVAMFDNQTFTTGLEVELTDALAKELQRSTPYAVVTSGSAQTMLTGTVTAARQRHLTSQRGTGLTEEMAIDLVVSFEWRDTRTGEPLVERHNFRAVETFVPARPSNERIELGRHAAVQEMARSIVAELRSAW
jgi:hypothetical protein